MLPILVREIPIFVCEPRWRDFAPASRDLGRFAPRDSARTAPNPVFHAKVLLAAWCGSRMRDHLEGGSLVRVIGSSRLRRAASFACLVVSLVLFAGVPCHAAIESRDILKTYFETGDKPTEEQFESLIDSVLNLGLTYGSSADAHRLDLDAAGGIGDDGVGNALRLEVGATIDSSIHRLDDGVDVGGAWPGAGPGFLAVIFELPDALGTGTTTHYGFVEMSVAGPSSADPYAIYLHGFAWESDPDTPITTFHLVPEPSTSALMLLGLLALSRRKRP